MAVPALAQAKRPSKISLLFASTLRVLFTTLLFTAGGMGVGLFLGILGTSARGILHGSHVDMRDAYRLVAIPFAAALGTIALIGATYLEVRDRRK